MVITITAATLSYVVVERPAVRLGRRWSRAADTHSTAARASH
jgi:peptidoglycan/LPS O-acetylase OafA/YrhL